jgi:hypothetical protein
MLDPTSAGDLIAEKVRSWYEANRESWWDRHRPSADRKGVHADEFMLRLIRVVGLARQEVYGPARDDQQSTQREQP